MECNDKAAACKQAGKAQQQPSKSTDKAAACKQAGSAPQQQSTSTPAQPTQPAPRQHPPKAFNANCRKCGRLGHRASDCVDLEDSQQPDSSSDQPNPTTPPAAATASKSAQPTIFNGKCRTCGGTGHKAANCLQTDSRPSEQIVMMTGLLERADLAHLTANSNADDDFSHTHPTTAYAHRATMQEQARRQLQLDQLNYDWTRCCVCLCVNGGHKENCLCVLQPAVWWEMQEQYWQKHFGQQLPKHEQPLSNRRAVQHLEQKPKPQQQQQQPQQTRPSSRGDDASECSSDEFVLRWEEDGQPACVVRHDVEAKPLQQQVEATEGEEEKQEQEEELSQQEDAEELWEQEQPEDVQQPAEQQHNTTFQQPQ